MSKATCHQNQEEHEKLIVTPDRQNSTLKASLNESVHDQLKNVSRSGDALSPVKLNTQRHQSVLNFMINLLVGPVAYIYQKPSLDIYPKELAA